MQFIMTNNFTYSTKSVLISIKKLYLEPTILIEYLIFKVVQYFCPPSVSTLDISYGCASTGWPSSTKAELVAIWTAVLAIPSNFSHINIYTDSQAAIDGITNGLKSTWSIRQYSKTPNATIIEQIIKTVETKGQDIKLIKVKGHSGNVYNDIADDIAKNAVITAHQDPSFILELSHISMQSRLQFKLFWKELSWDD